MRKLFITLSLLLFGVLSGSAQDTLFTSASDTVLFENGSTKIINSCSGVIVDDGGINGDYSSSFDGLISIVPEYPNQRLGLRATDLNLESGYDYLNIYEGEGTSGTRIEQITGDQSVPAVLQFDATGTITLEMTSDGSVVRSGFAFELMCSDTLYGEFVEHIYPNDGDTIAFENTAFQIVHSCDAILTDNGGAYESYTSDFEGALVVQPDEPNKYVQLELLEFYSEEGDDSLKVYKDQVLLNGFSGFEYVPTVFSAADTGAVTIEFISDAYTVESGFVVKATCVDIAVDLFIDTLEVSNGDTILMENEKASIIKTCNAVIVDDGGVEGDYSSNFEGYLQVVPEQEDRYIVLEVLQFNSEENDDSLNIYNLSGTRMVQSFSGMQFVPMTFSDSIVGGVSLEFNSDNSRQEVGYIIKASCAIQPVTLSFDTLFAGPNDTLFFEGGVSKVVKSCEAILVDDGGVSADYNSNVHSRISLVADDPGKQIFMKIIEFETEERYDELFVYEGFGVNGDELGVYSGLIDSKNVFAENHGVVTFEFDADGSNQASGFLIEVSCLDSSENYIDSLGLSSGDTILLENRVSKTVQTCDALIVDDGGLEEDYTSDFNGTVTVLPDAPDEFVKLEFEQFSTNSKGDTLKVYAGTDTEGQLIGAFTDFEFTSTTLSGPVAGPITLEFSTDNSVVRNGFSIRASCSSTSIELITDSLLFVLTDTMNMMDGVASLVKSCDVVIVDDGGLDENYSSEFEGAITILPENLNEFVQLNMVQFGTHSENDFVRVFSGYNMDGPELYEFSGLPYLPARLTAPISGPVTIAFTSDQWNTSDGFVLDASCVLNATDLIIDTNTVSTYDTIQFHDAEATIIKTCDALLTDDGGAFMDYSSAVDGIITIVPENLNQRLTLTSESFQLENGDDFLHIYGGYGTSGELLQSLTGTENDTVDYSPSYGPLTLKFVTDGGPNYEGFRVSVSCSEPLPDNAYIFPTNGDTLKITTCDAILFDDGGPDHNISFDAFGHILVTPSQPDVSIEAWFTNFDLVGDDTLTILEIDSSSNWISQHVIEWNSAPNVYNSVANKQVLFTVDQNQDFVRDGIEFHVSCKDPLFSDDLEIVDLTVAWGSNADGFTLIPGVNPFWLELNEGASDSAFAYIDIFISTDDVLDSEDLFLHREIIDGGYDRGRDNDDLVLPDTLSEGFYYIIAKVDPFDIYIEDDEVNNISVRKYYYDRTQLTVENSDTIVTCLDMLFDDGGFDGGYDSWHGHYKNLTTTIYPDNDTSVIALDISKLSLYSPDYLRVYDGASASAELIAEPWGFGTNKYQNRNIRASNPEGALTLVFYTNSSSNQPGFHALITCVSDNDQRIPSTGQKIDTTCSRRYRDYSGEHMMTNDVGTDGMVTVHPTEPGKSIVVNLLEVGLWGDNVLDIYSGDSIDGDLLLSLDALTMIGDTIESPEVGPITVQFRNGSQNSQGTGFMFEVSCVDAVLTAQGGLNVPQDWSVFPNPVHGDLLNLNGIGQGQYVITNVDGFTLISGTTEFVEENAIDVSYLESGVYILTIYEEGEVKSVRITKI